MSEPRSPDVQYCEISMSIARQAHHAQLTSMTMKIRSFFGSFIFWISCTILRCFSESRMALIMNQLESICRGVWSYTHTSARICFLSFSVILE